MILVSAVSLSLNPLLVAAENHHLTPSRMKAHMLQQLDLACMSRGGVLAWQTKNSTQAEEDTCDEHETQTR